MIFKAKSISYRINQELTKRAQQFGLILDDISITHLTFGQEFTAAVELKQVAQQEAEKARFLVEKAEQIKKANIISAEGDTQAAELLAEAIGKSGEYAERDKIKIFIGDELVTNNGLVYENYSEVNATKHLKKDKIQIKVDIGVGKGLATVYTCDLTHKYIEINADYRS